MHTATDAGSMFAGSEAMSMCAVNLEREHSACRDRQHGVRSGPDGSPRVGSLLAVPGSRRTASLVSHEGAHAQGCDIMNSTAKTAPPERASLRYIVVSVQQPNGFSSAEKRHSGGAESDGCGQRGGAVRQKDTLTPTLESHERARLTRTAAPIRRHVSRALASPRGVARGRSLSRAWHHTLPAYRPVKV